jgi:alcohol dehydrogenase, propanol-preferring
MAAPVIIDRMRSWHVEHPGPVGRGPLREYDTPVPSPGKGELLLRVLVCGVCRTDLHVAEGDLPVHRPAVVPGHEVVGEVVALGDGAAGDGGAGDFAVGQRVGVAWLRHTCGRCRYCLRGAENLCPESRYTGWDADGGYAEYTTVPASYSYHLPAGYSDAELAPLLCAGIIGYRALRRAELPAGGRLGIYGFGASAHLAAQVALARGAAVFVMTRSTAARELARDLGAAWVGGAADEPPEPLDAAILFAPVGDLVPPALAALDRGGTLSIAGIHLTDVPPLNYQRHLFQERQVRSVTANTREDGREFLRFAGQHRIRVTTTRYPLDRADRALADLAGDRVNGAAVLVP